MCKNRLFAIALGVLVAASSYAQTSWNQIGNGSLFFGGGWSSGIFIDDKLEVYSDYEIMRLNPVKIGAYYELPLGIGNFFAGLEGGFASGSNFGGGGDVSFLPVNLNATYAFGIADILYIGPSLKAGILGLLGHEKYNILPLLGAAIDLELRYKYFPLSVYAQGGVNAYPTTNGANVLPTVEVGLRFPRGSFGKRQASDQTDRSALSTGTSTTSGLTSQPAVTPPPPPPPPPVRQPFQFAPTATSRIITLDNGNQGLFSSVYFEPDTGVLIERYRPVMEEAGALLAANPELQLILRTYTALFGTAEGRYMVAMERGQYCRDYFIQYYGVAPSRITIEAYGSEREPASARTDDWVSYRCAELIISE